MSREDILLLGGNGFIGRALAYRLRQEHMTAHIVGRQNIDHLEQRLPLCHTVIHLASATTPGSSALNPELEQENIALTLRLLKQLQNHPQIHLIFFSSGGTVYGNPDKQPVNENSLIAPLSNHGAGKAAQEAFCQAFRARGHAVTILRPANAYGPGQTMRRGFGLVRTMLEHARCNTPIEIWGDGENVRDYIYIDDIVEASMRLIALPSDSSTYNLGSGIGYSVKQVRDIAETICGRQINTTFLPSRGIDVQSITLDTTRLNTRLNWNPTVGLIEGMRRTLEWMQET